MHLHVPWLCITHHSCRARGHQCLPVKAVLAPACHCSAGQVLSSRFSSFCPLFTQPSASSSSSFLSQLLGNQDHIKAELEKLKKTQDEQQQKLEEQV